MASIRSQVVDAIFSAVNGGGKPVGVTVHRSKTAPFAKAELPAIIVYRIAEELLSADGRNNPYVARRALTVRCECRVASTTDGEPLEDALDPLTSWVVQAVKSVATGRGTPIDRLSEVGTSWAVADEDAVYGAAGVDFRIEYLTAAGNPDAAP